MSCMFENSMTFSSCLFELSILSLELPVQSQSKMLQASDCIWKRSSRVKCMYLKFQWVTNGVTSTCDGVLGHLLDASDTVSALKSLTMIWWCMGWQWGKIDRISAFVLRLPLTSSERVVMKTGL